MKRGRKLIKIISAIALLSFFSTISTQAQEFITFRHEYGSFEKKDLETLEVVPSAIISNGALQLTHDVLRSAESLRMSYTSGRILLKQPFKLWDGNSTASFNTSFLINVYRMGNDTAGEGLAFIIAPDLLVPPNSIGQFLGITNSFTDGIEDNKIVAVEFDTFKQDFDPDDNHVGIDLNSVVSAKTEALTPHNITIAPIGRARFYNIWVDYDGTKMVIEVYVAEQGVTDPTPAKPHSPILWADRINLREQVKQYSYLGFSAATGNATELNSVLRWNLTVHYFPEKEEEKHGFMKIVVLATGVPALVVLLMGAAWLGYFLRKMLASNSNRKLVGELKNLPGTPREFRYMDLKKATHGFDEKKKLGEGGYGVVYRGLLAKEDMEIAVKCFSRGSVEGEGDFLAELKIINRLRHKNLVKLLGWCHKNRKLLLVYEYMPNGSLDQHLFIGPNMEPLQWNLRYRIILGIASALQYLHNDYEQRVVHRDLKASNIMLDSNFNARLGDFGLAQALENEKNSYTEAQGVLGTMWYIAPECFHTGKATQQSDVYAFGAVLLEVVCGRRPGSKIDGFQLLVDWVWFLHRDRRLLEAVDSRLAERYVAEEAEKLLLLGLACSHPDANERPKTQAIFQMIISGTMPVPEVPPFRPAFVWPAAGPPIDSYSSSAYSISQDLSQEGYAEHTEFLM